MHSTGIELVGRGDVLSLEERRQLADDVAALRATYESRWPRIPCGFAARSMHAREVLRSGVTPIDVATADPVRVLQELGAFVQDTVGVVARIRTQADLLGEALATDLSTMPLGQLRRVCRTIMRLADAPAPNPSWANPAEAYAADILLSALGDELREMADVRRRLYAEFSEDVWTLECAKRPLEVDKWWQSTRRHRARAELASVSRAERPPVDVKAAVAALRRAMELKAAIGDAWTAISGRLGHFADAGMPDVDGAVEALAAVHDLHRSLGEHVNPEALRDLVAADAFVSEELAAPANNIVSIITEWSTEAKRMKAANPLIYSGPQLERWAAETQESLELLAFLKDATGHIRAGVRTAGEIFEDTIVRDHVRELCAVVRPDSIGELDDGDAL